MNYDFIREVIDANYSNELIKILPDVMKKHYSEKEELFNHFLKLKISLNNILENLELKLINSSDIKKSIEEVLDSYDSRTL